jgi:predicted transcriptional regulator
LFLLFVVWTARNIYKDILLDLSKMFGLFGHKKRVEDLKDEVQDSFNRVKEDFGKVGKWIKHIDDKHGTRENELLEVKDQLLSIQNDILEMKDFISFFGQGLSKQPSTTRDKQPLSAVVQTPVQTAVQTDVLENLTVMERAIVWTLLNADMRLSYEDLAALLGKDKSTVRGQINTIKQKSESLIKESRESNGKKRLYIPEEISSSILKSIKVKVTSEKNHKNRKSED